MTTLTLTHLPCMHQAYAFELTDQGKKYTGVRHISQIKEMIKDLDIKNVVYK